MSAKKISISGILAVLIILIVVWMTPKGTSQIDAQPYTGVSTDRYAQRIEYDGSNRILYVGETRPEFQSRGASAVWRISKFYYDGATTRIVRVNWANRSPAFDFTWNDRTTYTY